MSSHLKIGISIEIIKTLLDGKTFELIGKDGSFTFEPLFTPEEWNTFVRDYFLQKEWKLFLDVLQPSGYNIYRCSAGHFCGRPVENCNPKAIDISVKYKCLMCGEMSSYVGLERHPEWSKEELAEKKDAMLYYYPSDPK